MPVIFCLFLGVFAVLIAVNIKRFIDNERSPVVTENAWLRRKRDNTSIDANGVMNSTLSLVFEVDGGTLECVVSGRTYRAVREGAHGLLTHQGTRFRCFVFDGIRVEK